MANLLGIPGRSWGAGASVALVIFALPGPVHAQDRVISRTQIERTVDDPALVRRLVQVGVTGVTPVQQDTTPIRLEAGEVLAGRTGVEAAPIRESARLGNPALLGDRVRERPVAQQLALPFHYFVPAASDGALLALRPIYEPRVRLRYDPADRVYRGSFYLALQDTARPGSSRPLSAPVRLQVSSDVAEMSPESLELTHTNLPFHAVEVVARRVGDGLRVRIIPEFDLTGVDVWLPAEPTLTVESVAPRIAGFGIQTGIVTVAIHGGGLDGPTTIRLLPTRGSIDPDSVRLTAGQATTVRIRSAGIGPATVRAFAPGLIEAETDLAFGWPVLFVLVALLGGMVGGLGAALHHRRDGGGVRLRDHMLPGTIFGLLVATVYYAVGINLLGVHIDIGYFNEAAVFALAALAGLLGLPLLTALGATRRQPTPHRGEL
jgi:hypothetical protein